MTSIAVAALILLAKGMLLLCIGAAIASCNGRNAARMSLTWVLTFGALLLLPATSLLPAWSSGSIAVSHALLSLPYVAEASMVLWAGGAALSAIRLFRDVHAARALAARAQDVLDARTLRLFDDAKLHTGVSAEPSLRCTNELSTAAVIGWRHPVVLLPADHQAWSEEELLGILCHELAHVRRRDWASLLLERVVGVLYWPNPLLSIARRYSAMARELVADEAVLRAPVRRDAYATRLIALARGVGNLPSPRAAVALADQAGLRERVHALYSSTRDRRPAQLRAIATALVCALALLVLVGAAQPFECIPSVRAVSNITTCV